MHGLRASVLLRRSDALLTAALLVVAQAAFLWMFFAADALEQLAGSHPSVMRFASDWRHGTAGNAWLYMPGFFATAAAAWLAEPRLGPRPMLSFSRAALVAGAIAAFATSAFGGSLVLYDFERFTSQSIADKALVISPIGVLRGLYTLMAWTVFVIACRRALEQRRFRPFVPAGVLAAGLALARPWTLGAVGRDWTSAIAAGDPIAWTSALAIPIVAGLLAASVQWSQSRTSPACPAVTRRATSAKST